MKHRTFTDEQKAKIILEGFTGKPVSQICNDHQINQSLYYRWRDEALQNLPSVFGKNRASKQEQRLLDENYRLKQCVADLTLELKKSEYW